MAVKKFYVVYDKKVAGTQLPPSTETSKAGAEALHGKFKEKVVVKGPLYDAKVVEIEAEDEKQAAVAARVLVGAKEGEGELLVGETANVKSNTGR